MCPTWDTSGNITFFFSKTVIAAALRRDFFKQVFCFLQRRWTHRFTHPIAEIFKVPWLCSLQRREVCSFFCCVRSFFSSNFFVLSKTSLSGKFFFCRQPLFLALKIWVIKKGSKFFPESTKMHYWLGFLTKIIWRIVSQTGEDFDLFRKYWVKKYYRNSNGECLLWSFNMPVP